MHISKVKFLFALLLKYFCILISIKLRSLLLPDMIQIFIKCHHYRSINICAAYFISEDISVKRIVILHFLLQIFRALQVCRALLKVVKCYRRSLLHCPARIQQRVWNCFVFNLQKLSKISRDSIFLCSIQTIIILHTAIFCFLFFCLFISFDILRYNYSISCQHSKYADSNPCHYVSQFIQFSMLF